MPEFHTIVAAVDGADTDERIVEAARAFAVHAPAARVHLVHAVPTWAGAFEDVLFPYLCMGDDRVAIEAELFDAATAALAKRFEGVSARVVVGPPAAALHSLLAELGPELLVVGATGRHHAIRQGMGAVAERLAADAACDVLVHRAASPAASTGPTLKRIVVAVDLTPPSAKLLETAMELATVSGAEVIPVFVLPTPYDRDHAEIWKPQDPHPRVIEDTEKLARQLMSLTTITFPTANAEVKLQEVQIRHGEPALILCEAADELGADLIVIGRRSITGGDAVGLGTITRKVAQRASCDVFIQATT